MTISLEQMMKVITDRTSGFLKEETYINVESNEFVFDNNQPPVLKHLTALVSINSNINVYIAFSFDEPLIEQAFTAFTADIDIEPDEREEYIEETASEIINIVIGNATADFQDKKAVVSFSPPVVISNAKRLVHHKDAKFFTSNLHTNHGEMSIFCIGPSQLFNEQLQTII